MRASVLLFCLLWSKGLNYPTFFRGFGADCVGTRKINNLYMKILSGKIPLHDKKRNE